VLADWGNGCELGAIRLGGRCAFGCGGRRGNGRVLGVLGCSRRWVADREVWVLGRGGGPDLRGGLPHGYEGLSSHALNSWQGIFSHEIDKLVARRATARGAGRPRWRVGVRWTRGTGAERLGAQTELSEVTGRDPLDAWRARRAAMGADSVG
jgi:hypothetical protein